MRRSDITEDEFERLFRRCAADVQAYLRVRVGGDSEDLLAEVFVIAWRRRRDMPGPEARRGWLFGVARRLVLAEMRRRKRSRETWEGLVADFGQGAAEALPDRTAKVRQIVRALPDRDRELIVLTLWEGLTINEAALAMNMRPGTVRVRLHRARQRLAMNPQLSELLEDQVTSRW